MYKDGSKTMKYHNLPQPAILGFSRLPGSVSIAISIPTCKCLFNHVCRSGRFRGFRIQVWLTGWWLGHPSEKYESQLGWFFLWQNQFDGPNHQPAWNHPSACCFWWDSWASPTTTTGVDGLLTRVDMEVKPWSPSQILPQESPVNVKHQDGNTPHKSNRLLLL